MREISYREALREALIEEMRRDDSVFILGEEIAKYGGALGVTKGLLDEFGPYRVIDTPISESALVGAGVGAALMGMRPVVEIMFNDLLTLCMDHIVNSAAKVSYVHDGQASCPLVVRTAHGGLRWGVDASQSLEAWFVHVPGLKVVVPSTPYDAKGLLKTAIRDPDPVIFFEPKALYDVVGLVPDDDYTVPFGVADVKRKGNDVTIVAFGALVVKALAATQKLALKGIDAEVIDPRTLTPLDKGAILDSVRKTGRLVIAHDAVKTGGMGAEIAAIVAEEGLGYLKAPVKRVANPDVPVAFSPPLQEFILPQEEDLLEAVENLMACA